MKQQRNLDGVYFRVMREGKPENVCFSDLTEEEMQEVLQPCNIEQVKRLTIILAETVYRIGEQFGIEVIQEQQTERFRCSRRGPKITLPKCQGFKTN